MHHHFCYWAYASIWERLLLALSKAPDTEYCMIDSAIVGAHQQAESEKGATNVWSAPKTDWGQNPPLVGSMSQQTENRHASTDGLNRFSGHSHCYKKRVGAECVVPLTTTRQCLSFELSLLVQLLIQVRSYAGAG